MNADRVNFLKKLKAYGLVQDIPNVSWDTAEFLFERVIERAPETILEIGTANGFSTIWLASALEQCASNGKIVTIERSAPSFKESIENFETVGVGEMICSIYGDAKVVLEDWNNSQKEIKVISDLEEVPKGPQYLEGKGLEYIVEKGEREFPATFDLVFLDAQKIHYGTFWDLIQPLLTDKSWVIVDDVLKFAEKTESFMTEIKNQFQWNYEIFQTDSDDGVMVLKKT